MSSKQVMAYQMSLELMRCHMAQSLACVDGSKLLHQQSFALCQTVQRLRFSATLLAGSFCSNVCDTRYEGLARDSACEDNAGNVLR